MRTWTLSDGRAGNQRQVLALARALGLQVAQDWILRPGLLARTLAPHVWPGAQHAFGPEFAHMLATISAAHSLTAPDSTLPQLAIGCGRQAALATRLLRANAGSGRALDTRCQVVQILDPRLDPRHWDVVVAPEHDRLRGANVISVLGSLNSVDDTWLAQARDEFSELGKLPEPRVAVLVGGPTRHAPLQRDALLAELTQITAAVRAGNGSVLLSTSRRTPNHWTQAMRDAVADLPGLAWFGADDARNPYPGLLAWANAIVCTADSVNMLSEACATRVPVFVICPEQLRGRLQRFVHTLRERRRIAPLVDSRSLVGLLAQAEPLRETEHVAAQIARLLQPHRRETAIG